jgi:predicted homoserine dehydrogenase-like protein
MSEAKYRIGIIGTGFIARGLMLALKYHPELGVSKVLTRRNINEPLEKFPLDTKVLTNSIEDLIKSSDLVVECSGDVIYGTEMVEKVLEAGLPVVTMNSELQVVSGTQLARKGTLIEAEGDQPGSLASLDLEVRDMGFEPVVYGNIKRFLNLNPLKDEMEYWSKRQGISLDQVTAFTDGTKVQIEQTLVANGLGSTILCRNLSGIPCKALEDGAYRLGEMADGVGQAISDYVLSATAPAGVFIVAKHQSEQKPYLEYLKLGEGPYYVIVRPYHLCHLEIPRTIINVLKGYNSRYKFNNGQNPVAQTIAIAKKNIEKGTVLRRGLGSFEVRGEAAKISNFPNAVPIGLLQQATFTRAIAEGQIISFDDVELPQTRALELWKETVKEVLNRQ